ncbi:AMP-binding protein [Streptomyces sp. TP-A0874]|uniref:AMP-binding protein n=1 Tax=Streptomyces sp. TP-A0874 TaxID=549819 RepID=UPI000852A57A|nr:AMP-binding protein [Streptomyces sp. TP-A0874]
MRDLTSWLESPPEDTGLHFYDGKSWHRTGYPEMAEQVRGAAAALRRQGVRQGDRVALVLGTGPEFVRYFFGAMAVGATPTPIAPAGYQGPMDHADFVAGLLDTLRPGCVVTEGATLETVAGLPERIRRSPDGTEPRVIDAGQPLPEGGERERVVLEKDDLGLIQFTSGSSSAPRGVTLTSQAVLAQVSLLERKYRIGPGCSFGSWLPLHHDMGLIGLLVTPVLTGSDVWLMRPEHFVRKPLAWLEVFGRQGGTHGAIPNFALEKLVRRVRSEDLQGMDFSSWTSLIVGADRVSMPVLDSVHRLLAPHGFARDTLAPSYGMAEATLAVAAAGPGHEPEALLLGSPEFSQGEPVDVVGRLRLGDTLSADDRRHSVVSCGSELLGVDLMVVGEDGHAVPDGHVGELLIRSPSLSAGYFGAPPEDERFTTGGYRTGDVGFRHEDEIYVLGRVGDSVKVNGRYVTAEDVDLALVRALGLQHDKLVVVLDSTAGRPAVLVCLQRGAARVEPERIGDVLETFGLSVDRTAVLQVGALAVPRTTSGKPQRAKLWRALSEGRLEGVLLHRGEDFPHRFEQDTGGNARVVPAHSPESGRPDSRAEVGGKGHHLELMRRAGLPVPPFEVLRATELREGVPGPESIRALLDRLAAADLDSGPEGVTGLAVRSSPPRSMPGMMDTLLGIGLTPEDIGPLTRRLGDEQAAWELLRLQARHLCLHVAGAEPARVEAAAAGADSLSDGYRALHGLYTELTGTPYPEEPAAQVRLAVEAVRDSWWSERARQYRRAHGVPDEPGPAVVVQSLVYGMAGEVSGSGVVFSHNPVDGSPGLFGEYLAGSTGEDLVSGVRTPRPVGALREQDERVHQELSRLVAGLHHRLGAMVEVEFVVERGRLWLVQVRPATAAPHVLNRVVLELRAQGRLTAPQALARLEVDALFTPLPPAVAGEPDGLLAVGLPACAGVAHGPVATEVDEVFGHAPGEAVLLRPTTEPADFAGMAQAAALLTLEGGGTSHAAVVARELNVPTVVGARIVDPDFAELLRRRAAGESVPLPEVTVCGTTGRVWRGRAAATPEVYGREEYADLLAAVESGTELLLAGETEADARSSALPRCASVEELPDGPGDRTVATGDPLVAEAWAARGGTVVFLHPPADPDRPWHTALPDCRLEAVVLDRPEQADHARWTLAVRTASRSPV